MIDQAISQAFVKGNHAEILEKTFDIPHIAVSQDNIAYVIGSLSFMGRLDEAETLLEGCFDQMSPPSRTEARFYLSLGHSRSWSFTKAREFLVRNLVEGRKLDAISRFYLFQGLGFYHFMSCRYDLSFRYASRAYLYALQANFFYGRAIALDLKGHCQVVLGEPFKGLEALEKAFQFFILLGNSGNAKAISRSLVLYRARHSLELDENLASLQQSVLDAQREENNFSLAASYLDMSRLYALRGRVGQAEELLNQAATLVQTSGLGQFQVLLNFRRAYLYYLRGQYQRALNCLEKLHEPIVHIQDLRTRLQVLGLEIAIMKSCAIDIDPQRFSMRKQLTQKSQYAIGHRILRREEGHQAADHSNWGKDPLGDALDELKDPNRSLEEKVEIIMKTGLWSFLYEMVPVSRQEKVLYINLTPGLLVVFQNGEVTTTQISPGSQLLRFFQCLTSGQTTKQELIEKLWGYRYTPLRHDTLIYGLVARVRNLLDIHQDWIESHEDGYRLKDDCRILFHQRIKSEKIGLSSPEKSIHASLEQDGFMNHRQYKIMQYVEDHDAINLQSCQNLFHQVSKVTLSRDLSYLVETKKLVRTGKGRSTMYLKSQN